MSAPPTPFPCGVSGDSVRSLDFTLFSWWWQGEPFTFLTRELENLEERKKQEKEIL